MGQPKERSAKKNVFVEKYDEIRSFDGTLYWRENMICFSVLRSAERIKSVYVAVCVWDWVLMCDSVWWIAGGGDLSLITHPSCGSLWFLFLVSPQVTQFKFTPLRREDAGLVRK
jgi:hypothetical protein